ncbi:SDR family oxidoreductase [Paraburkholderia caffeinilytica]|uniref:SDR family oxidoreductase n=1 Tax=Paraburkholderia caffeinilytica TaxID=1761016 RepID=UPI0038B778A5
MNQTDAGSKKSAIVFGGSRGIGSAIVRRLAKDGAAIAFTYASSASQAAEGAAAIEAAGGTAIAIKADSANIDEIEAAVEQTSEQFGHLDIAVINAGILMLGDVSEVSPADFDRMIAVNVRGVFFAIQAAARRMREGGRIVTIGSNVAVRSGFPGSSVYSLTKAAVATMVKGVAVDLAPRKITINNVQPGPIVTDMTSAHLEQIVPLIPLHRAGDVDEIAALVSFLANGEAAYMTGASVTIDGGLSL